MREKKIVEILGWFAKVRCSLQGYQIEWFPFATTCPSGTITARRPYGRYVVERAGKIQSVEVHKR